MKDKKEIEIETRNLNRNNPRENAIEELGEKLNEIALIYDPGIAIHSLTSLVLNYAVKGQLDKEILIKAIDSGYDLIKEEFDRMLKELDEKRK